MLAYSIHHRKGTLFFSPFLDVLVKRNSRNGNITTHSLLSTTIYRKPTHTNRYLHYTSRHPKHQKLTVAKTLLSRVNTHITDNTQKHSELQNIRSTLRLNGFPTRTTFLPDSHALRISNTTISLLYLTYKAHRKKCAEVVNNRLQDFMKVGENMLQ